MAIDEPRTDVLYLRFYPSEITTTRIRARGQAFAGFVNWMCVCELILAAYLDFNVTDASSYRCANYANRN
jgi:hypothetical protein